MKWYDVSMQAEDLLLHSEISWLHDDWIFSVQIWIKLYYSCKMALVFLWLHATYASYNFIEMLLGCFVRPQIMIIITTTNDNKKKVDYSQLVGSHWSFKGENIPIASYIRGLLRFIAYLVRKNGDIRSCGKSLISVNLYVHSECQARYGSIQKFHSPSWSSTPKNIIDMKK